MSPRVSEIQFLEIAWPIMTKPSVHMTKEVERKRKAKGRKIVEDKDEGSAKSGGNVVDLMAALKKSMEKSGTAEKKPPAKKAAPRKAPAKKRA